MGPELVFNPARARSHLESPVRATEWVVPSTGGEVPARNGLEWAGLAKYASDIVCCLADELTKELNAATDPGMDVSTQSSTSPHAPGDRRRMARFAKYARRATQRSVEHIRHGDNARDRTGLSRAIVPIMDTESDYHVIVEVRSARVRDVDGRQRPATHDDIAAAAGSLLYQPIHRSTITLEEWICCRTPMKVSNLFADTRFDCDFAGRAANTTVLYLPASPNWVYLDYVEMAQFAAALPALLRLWRSQLDEEHAKLLVEIEGSEWEEGSEATKNDRQSATLEHTRLELSGFTARIHGNRAALHSFELVQSPAHRVFFDNLLLAARVPIIDKELDSQVARVDSLYERLINFYVVQYERSTRGSQDVMQKILLGLAFLSLAGLASYINDVHFNRENNMTGKQELVQILIVSALAVLVIGCSVLWMRRRNNEFRKREV